MSSTPSPNWLAGWKPTDTLPASARADAEACIPALEADLAPAPPKALAATIARLVDWIEDFGITPMPDEPEARREKVARLSGRYREHLQHLPADLLVRCVNETMAAHRYRNLPLPAEMLARVTGELGRRRTVLGACRLALKLGRFDLAPVPEEDRVRPEQLRALRRDLAAAAAARTMPDADTQEDGEPAPPPNPRADRGADA